MNAKKAKILRYLAFIATAKNKTPGHRLVIDDAKCALVNVKGSTRAAYRQLKRMVRQHGFGAIMAQVGEHYKEQAAAVA
jgi:hypothetical protein